MAMIMKATSRKKASQRRKSVQAMAGLFFLFCQANTKGATGAERTIASTSGRRFKNPLKTRNEIATNR